MGEGTAIVKRAGAAEGAAGCLIGILEGGGGGTSGSGILRDACRCSGVVRPECTRGRSSSASWERGLLVGVVRPEFIAGLSSMSYVATALPFEDLSAFSTREFRGVASRERLPTS